MTEIDTSSDRAKSNFQKFVENNRHIVQFEPKYIAKRRVGMFVDIRSMPMAHLMDGEAVLVHSKTRLNQDEYLVESRKQTTVYYKPTPDSELLANSTMAVVVRNRITNGRFAFICG